MRLLSILLLTLLFCTGCESWHDYKDRYHYPTWGWLPAYKNHYYKVVTTDEQGELVASWVAKGPPQRDWDDKTYRFTAVERFGGVPPAEYHFPLGWKVRVASAHTIIYPVEKPAWLEGLTGLDVADHAERARYEDVRVK